MDIRDILKSFDQLTEGEKTVSDKGTVHKSGPGGYGNKHGAEDVKDQYGQRIGKASLAKIGKADAPPVKRGKGRPPKNADSSGEVKNYDSSELSKAMGMGKAPKPKGKPSVKHSLKEYFEQLDYALNEAGLAVQPMPASPQQQQQKQMASKPSFMIKDPANPNMPAITTQDPAVVQAAKNGTMSMQKPGAAPTQQTPGATPATGAGSQVAPMEEDGENWIKGAIKHPGAFTKKAKSHGMTPAQFRAKVLSHKEDYSAKTEKQAQLAKTLSKMHEAEAPQHFAQSSPISTGGRNPNSLEEGKKTVKKDDRAEKDGKKVTKDLEYDMGHKGKDDKKAEKAGKKVTKDIEYDDKKKKIKEAAKPDFLDLDKDGNKKEPMKNASIDSKRKNQVAAAGKAFNDADEYKKSGGSSKKKVKEGMEHHLQAARLEGKSHALRKMPYNCTHDDMEEARCYHDGFKEGLDECYGQMPIMGRTAVGEVSPEVGTMASYGADDMGMDEGNAFTAGLAKTPHGGKFKVGGSTFTDRTSYDSRLEELAFESLDKQLNALLESEEKVSEGMTVSISKGQQGTPDSVSVSAQDGEADQLLSIIKSAGMGLFGGEEQGFNAPQGTAGAHGGISVVDDHDGMMALMKKLSGGEMQSTGDYADEEGSEEEHMHGEEGHSHEGEEACNECGMMECDCEPSSDQGHDEQGQPVMGEQESEDQMAYNVAEENAPDSGADNTNADVAGNTAANSALATADAGEDEEEGEVYSKPVSEDGDDEAEAETEVDDAEEVEESIYESYANSADDTFEADIDFMTKVISGGLNKQKSTGQTTVPVIAGQKNRMGADGLGNPMKESTDLLKDYLKLSGL